MLLVHASSFVGPIVVTLDTSDAGAIPLDPTWEGPPLGALVTVPALPTSPEWESRGVEMRTAADAGLRMSLGDLQRVSDPSLQPSAFFKPGTNYLFALVGDPNATNALYIDGGINPGFDGRALHFVAIPTAPPPAPDGG